MVELAAEIAWKSPRITTAMTAKIARNQTDLRIHDVFRVVTSTTGGPSPVSHLPHLVRAYPSDDAVFGFQLRAFRLVKRL